MVVDGEEFLWLWEVWEAKWLLMRPKPRFLGTYHQGKILGQVEVIKGVAKTPKAFIPQNIHSQLSPEYRLRTVPGACHIRGFGFFLFNFGGGKRVCFAQTLWEMNPKKGLS